MSNVAAAVCFVFIAGAAACQSSQDVLGSKKQGALSGNASNTVGKSGREQTDSPREVPGEATFPDGAGCPPEPGPMVQIQPADLTSSIGVGPIRIGIDKQGQPVGDAVLRDVAAAVDLVEWPENRPIPFTTKLYDVSGNGYGLNGYRMQTQAYVAVIPNSDLADRWYAVRLKELPRTVVLPQFSQHERLPDGSVGARFAPGSHPTLSALRMCKKSDGVTAIQVDFSERIQVSPAISISLSRAGVAVPCELDRGKVPDAAGATSARHVRFVCENASLAEGSIDLSIGADVVSSSGGRLERPGRGLGALRHQMDVAALDRWDSNCRIFRPKE